MFLLACQSQDKTPRRKDATKKTYGEKEFLFGNGKPAGQIKKPKLWAMHHPEKLAQRDAASMRDLMEVCCLWVANREPIRLHVGEGAGFEKLEEMFYDGTLALNS